MRLRTAPSIALCAAALTLACAASAQAEPLAAPFDVQGTSPRADQIVLTWRSGNTPPTPGEHYVVRRNGEKIADTQKTEITDDWLLGGRLYEYVVIAHNDAGETVATDPVRVPTADADPLEATPYLQNVAATNASFMWQTFEEEVTGLELGLPDGRKITLARDSTLRRRHIVRIRNMRPDTTYSYTWQSGGNTGSGSFKTPPADPRSFSFDAIGDFGTSSAASMANMARINNGGSDFALTLGDNAYPTGSPTQIVNYVLTPLRDFFARKPLWLTVGNHDYMNLSAYKRFFEFPGGRLYYRFRYGDALFVALDSQEFGPKQKAWAARTLARSNARCKVVFFHHPIWSSDHSRNNAGRRTRQQAFIPMLQRGGADLVLNGHIHNYERSKPLIGRRISRKRGITYVVSGGGGAELRGFGTFKRPRWSARRAVVDQIMRFTYRDGRLSGRAITSGGAIIDRFTVRCK